MRKVLVIIAFFSWHQLSAQQVGQTPKIWDHPGAPTGFAGEKHTTMPALRSFVAPKKVSSNSYAATFYTFNDVGIFSYFDSTIVTIVGDSGKVDTTFAMSADSFDSLSPGNGIYTISGNKPFAALTGDAITSFASGYFAVDENGNAVSTKLNTWMMKSPPDFDPHFILFSYDGPTEFAVKDLGTGNLIYQGFIDTTGYFSFPNVSLIEGKAVQVTSDRPVSALSYTDQGYYVPSTNGTFAGNLFYGYSGYISGLENSITLTSYSDSNAIVVSDLASKDTILVDTLGRWQVKTIGISTDTYWKVSSSGIITAADIPFAGWTGNYYNLTQCADSTGKNIGTSFVIPAIGGNLSVISYDDNNEVNVIELGDTSYPYTSTTHLKDVVLQNGGVSVLTTPSGNNVFRVQSDFGVSVVQWFNEDSLGGGASFVPINNSAASLPDLAIAQSDVVILPTDSIYQTGENVTVELTVHNYGQSPASNISVAAYDGNPDLGFARTLSSQVIPSIPVGGSGMLSFPMMIPTGPQYHSIFVKVDPGNLISEVNKSNNETSVYLLPNNYIQSPFAVYFSSPGSLSLQGSTLSPNPFQVTADIFNTTSSPISPLVINVSSTNGMVINSGPTDTTIGSFPGGSQLKLTWSLLANKDSSGFGLLNLYMFSNYLDTNALVVGILIPDTVAPPIPQSFSVTTDSLYPGQATLTWIPDSTRDLAGYKIYYSLDSTNLLLGTGAKQGNSPIYVSNVDSFVVNGLPGGASYWFAVSSFDYSMNESPRSSPMNQFVVLKVRGEKLTPKTFALFQNYPNPFNPTTSIDYQLPTNSHVKLDVFDLLGREVGTLVNREETAGSYTVSFDASNLPSGVYFYRITAGGFRAVRKLVLLK